MPEIQPVNDYAANVLATGNAVRITGEFAALPAFVIPGYALTAPVAPVFPAVELTYGIAPVVYQGQAMPNATIAGEVVPVVNDSALEAAAVVVGSQGANGLTSSLLNRVAYVGTTAGAGSVNGATLAAVPTKAPESGAVLFSSAALGEEPRTFTRNGTALAVTPELPSAPANASVVLLGNR